MARNIAKIIEALKTDENSNIFWWDILGNNNEARQIVADAFKETPTEEELSYLLELLELDKNKYNKLNIYHICLNELRKELIEIES